MFVEEGKMMFDARSASLGHTLQGGIPSPMDRVRAVRLSLKCMAFMEEHHEALRHHPGKNVAMSKESAAVITIQGSAVKWVPVQDILSHADAKNRRGRETWWKGIPALVEMMVGRRQFLSL
jgi:6-phosphofructokinase 1